MKYAKEYRVHLKVHAHIDMNWILTWDDMLKVIERDFSTIAFSMDKYPDFHFSQSQAVVFKVTEENFPELFKKISEKVLFDNWNINAPCGLRQDIR